jgi:hypothetical protein
LATASVIPLHNGINAVDLNADGTDDLVVKWRNPEGVSSYASSYIFLLRLDERHSDPGPLPAYVRVPIWDSPNGDKGDFDVRTSVHADCVTREVRLIREPNSSGLSLIVASRDLGESQADPAMVRFHVYRLQRAPSSTALPGEPDFYFLRERVATSRRAYCDVNRAFLDELGIGSAGGEDRSEQSPPSRAK